MHKQQYAEERDLLGKLCPGEKQLEGKTFYLDNVKKRSTALLLEAISLLGGRIESFLHKDVNFVVTGGQESLKEERCAVTKGGAKGTNEEDRHPVKRQESVLSSEKQRPGTPRPMACGSRGKALLEKAIRNNERLQGSSVLANARSWGVKILYVDDVLLYLKQLTRESFSMKHKRQERTYTKQQGSHVVKASALRSPYLKIEDLSRKYKPLHIQSMTFPSLCYLGQFSPFESPPPQFENQTEHGENKTRENKKVESSIQDKSQTPVNCNPSPWRPRKKDASYCECCHLPFTNLEEHLQSDQHRMFVLDPSNYSVVDQLVAEMLPGFNPNPSQESEETLNRPPTPLPIQDICELEPLTDVETERAVQALHRQSSSFNTHISSPARGPFSIRPASPSPGVQFPIPSPATLSADILSFTPTECQFPDIQPHAASPAMPELDLEPQAHASASQQPPPCYETQCPSPDPYSLPPVLSPKVPYSSYIVEPHSPYSEPPILSPQQYTAEEAVEEVICEMDTAESLSESVSAVTVPVSIPRLPSVTVTNADEVKRSNHEGLLIFSGIICSSSGLECDKLASRRSRSLPRQSAMAPNLKKRCRSASPEHSCSKRRRITVKFGYNFKWTEQGHKSTKSKSEFMAKSESCLLLDKTSCQIIQCCPHQTVSSKCTMETLDSKQAFTTFCVPTLQNFTLAPIQTDILGHSRTSVATPSKAKTRDSPLQFPKDKSLSAFSSQDSHRSSSHSTSVCIESALIPDLAALSPSSSDSDWDCDLLSRLGPTSATLLSPTEQSCELDKELLHRPCTWMQDTSYESRLHTALETSTPATSLCGEEIDPSVFSRTVVQIVEVQH
ncbi:uncharacterized protein dbf4b [Xiphias gladius]|uniref:uncharacterized protein dbf4b n=1 Tax=Xiphias gladius TaxID=8245 RepID=UPI001A983884|nr:uncharacterized protein dbf4b [Xiphias gladius]XP_039991980.1 uncharacterized protein dbf4b [Xiphias gladius]XP_039991981.1 uncharacterized protein dbf4b [Xiphias gladius]XP_039991982.1 uncharacterized protein dbf4b [Xiphias gladius]